MVSRALVIASALAAVLSLLLLAAPLHPALVGIALAGAAVIAASSRLFPVVAARLALVPVYLAPALFVVTIGNNHYSYAAAWLAALLALVASSSGRGWSLPTPWRWPLVAWALLVAVSWPVIAARELDYTFATLFDSRLPVAGAKISAARSVNWICDVAAIQLLGLLWFDWLFRTYPSHADRFKREVVWPLGASLGVAAAVGAYQGLVDVAFLSGHAWPSLRRATGTLMDANVFGMLAALWGPAFLVMAAEKRSARALAAGVAALLLTWIGVWASASKTAALAAMVGFAIALPSLMPALPEGRIRRRLLAAAGGAVVLLGLIVALYPARTVTALERGRHLLPDLSFASVRQLGWTLWERDGYGTASVAMIREFPFTGVGVGNYVTLSHDFALERARRRIPSDNAQNWYRQQLAELGLLGSIGWIAWLALFAVAVFRRRGGGTVGPGVALRGPLVAFALASLVAVPAQDPAIVITFWTLAFWFLEGRGGPGASRSLPDARGWIVSMAIVLLVCAYAAAQAMNGDLRPPFRAARFGFPYSYGIYRQAPNQAWTAKHAVTVLAAPQNWMRLTLRVDHPDASGRPVDVDVWRDHEHVVNEPMRLHDRLVRYVPVPAGKRFVLETKVDRTFRPSGGGASRDTRDLGLALQWEFVPALPK